MSGQNPQYLGTINVNSLMHFSLISTAGITAIAAGSFLKEQFKNSSYASLTNDIHEGLLYVGLGALIVGSFGVYGTLFTAVALASAPAAVKFMAAPIVKAFLMSSLIDIEIQFANSAGATLASDPADEVAIDLTRSLPKLAGYGFKYWSVANLLDASHNSGITESLGANWVYMQEFLIDAPMGGANFALSEELGANATRLSYDQSTYAVTHQGVFGTVDSVLYNIAGLYCGSSSLCMMLAAITVEHAEDCYKEFYFNKEGKCLALRIISGVFGESEELSSTAVAFDATLLSLEQPLFSNSTSALIDQPGFITEEF